ncbi:TadE/TadG family type IV pilus assembly protein [Streptomyces sp. NPDC021608]|uniref:TadE/TadG family type IV pilus assembly protein n=1 Tax=Streptomyces sp. NPDC021608 TaxID=3154903 RepID=UPI0033F3700E
MAYRERASDPGRGPGQERRSRRGRGEERGGGRGRDRGQAAIEYLGFLPVLLAVALAVVQLGLVAYGAQQAGTAARTGARSASLHEDYAGDCARAVSSWLAAACAPAYSGDEVQVTSTVTIPSVIPGVGDFEAHRTATMPVDH